MDTPAHQQRLAEIARAEEHLGRLSADRPGWKPTHLTEWPSVANDAFDRLVAFPDVVGGEVMRVTGLCSETTRGLWELGRQFWRDGVGRVDGAGREIWDGLVTAAETLTSRRPGIER